ncbi:peptidoglycan-binding domain-containing protein [Streptomyces coffeae]|uniref:Peptidoglycan-binding protein n=1 Tax=Streptomyces coffeae TaxID=621382 RepID=A0ABS1NEE1_9ACTN|nr:peptidoglycan-binding protein [Streptomyces coffeae]
MPATEPASVPPKTSRQRASASTPPSREPLSAHRRKSSSHFIRTLSRGDVGPDVERLQQVLFGQGFTYVSATGVFDDATLRGVVQYQRNRGITGDPLGVFGPVTRASSEAVGR